MACCPYHEQILNKWHEMYPHEDEDSWDRRLQNYEDTCSQEIFLSGRSVMTLGREREQ